MERRDFLRVSGAACAVALVTDKLQSATLVPDSRIEIMIDETIGTISPNIYGHFIEHVGTVIYDGVWVGKNSKIPNIQGIRSSLVDKLRRIHAPMIRWPGGCFADSYDWNDGVGENRPRRTDFWVDDFDKSSLDKKWVQMYDSNAFGTDEFLRLCKVTGAEPYLAANVRSLSAMQLDRWVEYCNSPTGSTTLADLRGRSGSAEPYDVKLWGIGNESWGCGGNFTPQDYASEYRRYTSWIPKYGLPLQFIASGPSGNDLAWTHGFLEKMYSAGDHKIDGLSVHYYAWNLSRGKSTDWMEAKGDALRFDEADWYELFSEGVLIEQIIKDQWSAMGEFDAQHDIKLVMDEYGPWYRKGTELNQQSIFSQQVTLRDALFTAITLNIFNRHADKISMAACAQTINCLNSLFLAQGDKFLVTPNYYVFEMYLGHQGAQEVRNECFSPASTYKRDGVPASFPSLHSSASLKGKVITLSVVNTDIAEPRETEIVVRGVHIRSVKAEVLSASDRHAHNTFEEVQVGEPAAVAVQYAGNTTHFTFPAASVSVITIELG